VARNTRSLALWYGLAAAAIALLTPIVRTTPLVDDLPLWFQWYIKPAGDLTTFTLFPWAGFLFAGAACGAIVATADDAGTDRRVQMFFGAASVVLIGAGDCFSKRAPIYQRSDFWTSSPTWFAIRVGILMAGVAVLFVLGEWAARSDVKIRPLERLGRSSL